MDTSNLINHSMPNGGVGQYSKRGLIRTALISFALGVIFMGYVMTWGWPEHREPIEVVSSLPERLHYYSEKD